MFRFGAFCSGVVFMSTIDLLRDGRYWGAALGGALLAWDAVSLIREWRAKRRPATIRF